MKLLKRYRSERVQLAGMAFVALATFGCFVALVMVGTTVVRSAAATADRLDNDHVLLGDLASKGPAQTLQQQISTHESILLKLKDPATIKQQREDLAFLYDEQGRQFLRVGNIRNAEQSFQTASALDPRNSNYYFHMAQLYAAAAVKQKEADTKVELLQNSKECFDDAIRREDDASRRHVIVNQAASTMYALGREELQLPGKRGDGIADLAKAKQLADPGSTLAENAGELLFLAKS